MSISKKTAKEMLDGIHSWCDIYNVRKDNVFALLVGLSLIQGNKSYSDSIKMLIKFYNEEKKKEGWRVLSGKSNTSVSKTEEQGAVP